MWGFGDRGAEEEVGETPAAFPRFKLAWFQNIGWKLGPPSYRLDSAFQAQVETKQTTPSPTLTFHVDAYVVNLELCLPLG